MRLSLIAVLTAAVCTGCSTVREPESTVAEPTSISLRLGMRHADALASLKRVGAEPFACSYLYSGFRDNPDPYFTYTSITEMKRHQ
jgi:hypothetical protein